VIAAVIERARRRVTGADVAHTGAGGNMAKLSSAAWMVHNVGLATAIGGTLFGREALEPALHEIVDRGQREQVSTVAWRRFSWMNLASHAAVAATWFVGRAMLSGRSVSNTGRGLTVAKDALIVASLATGLASTILGRILGARTANHSGLIKTNGETDASGSDNERLRRAVGALGVANMVANIGIVGVTTALSMEASESLPFSAVSRRLP
jgi:uncharacterized membrane protein